MTDVSPLGNTTRLRTALDDADIVPLLMVLVHFTEDVDLLDRCAPFIRGPFDYMQHIPNELKHEILERLVIVLGEYAAGTRSLPSSPADDLFTRMMSVAVGHPIPAKYIEM